MHPALKYWLISVLSMINLFLFLQAHPMAVQKLGEAVKGGLASMLPIAIKQNQEKDAEDSIFQEHGSKSVEISLGPGQPALSLSTLDSGGNHCCTYGEVFDTDTADLAFSSAEYGLDGRISLEDLDGDGVVEIIQNLTSFHFYNGLCYADSPRVDAVFAYDRKTRRFAPAHEHIPALWQDTLKEARRKQRTRPVIPDLDTAQDYEAFAKIRTMESQAVEKAVALIFAGYEREAYIWLKRQFVPSEGKRVCKTLREHLASESYYQYLKEHKWKKRAKKRSKAWGSTGRLYAVHN